ncbi:MAG: GNAT family N-acetyltransferase [Planctomycetota bacterium]
MSSISIDVEQVYPGTELFRCVERTREEFLLIPTGRTIADYESTHPGFTKGAMHFAALLESPNTKGVVGCVSVMIEEPGIGRVLQMATHDDFRGMGIGKQLLDTVEDWARGIGACDALMCHARDEAAGFYKRCGWRKEGHLFEEAGIPHWRMRKSL